ncbi:MAG: glycosyl hydrolase [Cyclobacteriaceae bacterium]
MGLFIRNYTTALLVLSIICLPNDGFAQRKKSSTTNTVSFDETLYKGMEWRLVGPFRGGRAGTVTGVKGNDNLYYMGTAGGGVWRTKDAGTTWECISDGYFGGSIGAVAVAPSDPNVIYVGEGEQTLRGNVSSGHGIWRSTDAGKTWNYLGLPKSEHIARIRIHPQDPDHVYVAVIGNLWKPNPERGVYESTDGGATWNRILYVSDKAGAGDLILDPNNPRIIYATTWQMKRNGYRMDSGGPDSHLFKSTDGGKNWEKITNNPGLPKGTIGIIGVTVSPVNSERVWAIFEANDGGVFRSDNGGKTWKKTNEDRGLRQRAWYYSRIYADTQNEDIVYVMNVRYYRSKNGGETFEEFNAPHGDHHDLWIDPDNNQRMAIADDGGAQVSNDGGANWTTYLNQPTAQFYRVTTDNYFPYRIYGAQQDNSTVRISHRTSGNAITERDWEPTAGGESAHLAPDPKNPDIVFGGTYKGYMMMVDHSLGQTRSTNVWPINPAGSGAEVMKYRFNWNYPIMFSPNDPNKLYAGSNQLHVTRNAGQSWEVISPDLTRAKPETIESSGGPITQDNTGAEFYANIFTMAESPQEPGVIWVGSDDGLVHITRDGGKNWENITPPDSPELNMMNCIDVNPFVNGGAYLAATSYKFGDYTPYLWKTTDYGQTWTKITSGINPNYYTRAIRADPMRKGLLYAGTEWGMYVSFDDGQSWQPFQLNLPVTSIRDLHVRDNNLIAATHGRSFWMIDDLTPLHQLNDQIKDKNAHLYQPKDSYRMAQGGWGGRDARLEGENHPDGVIFHYFIKELEEDNEIKLEILENDGGVIRTFSSKPENGRDLLKPEVGGNRFVWNMRYPGFTEFPGMILYSSPNRGPKALPGNYSARLTVGTEVTEQTFSILKDPRLKVTDEELKKQFDFLVEVRDKVSEAHDAMNEISKVKGNLNYLNEQLPDEADFEELKSFTETFGKDMGVIENEIHMTKNKSFQDPLNYGIKLNNRLAFLMQDQQRGDYPPTDQALEVQQVLTDQMNEQLTKLNKLFEERIPQLNRMIEEKGIKMISVEEDEVVN